MKKLIALVLVLTLALTVSTAFAADAVKRNGDLTIDCSHMDQGYVMVKGKTTSKRLKVRVKTADSSLNYDLNSDGIYETFPLQFGSGEYDVILFQQVAGKEYRKAGEIRLNVTMEDPNTCFLYPNQYVNFDENTACVIEANNICAGITDQAQIYKTICDYIKSHFVYDFVKSVSVKAGVLPDIDGCWEKHMGICQDLSAVTIAMLRSQGVPARLMIGNIDGKAHAWVSAVINGEEVSFDPTADFLHYRGETPVVERWY